MKKRIVSILVLSLLSTGIIGCGKVTSDEAIKAINEKKYSQFAKDYESLSDEDKAIVDEKLSDELAAIVKEFTESDLKEEKYNEAVKEINEITPESHKVGSDEVISKLTELYNEGKKGYDLYDSGIAFLDNKEYDKALEEFNKISKNHPVYEEVKGKIILASNELEKLKPAPVELGGATLSRNIIDNQLANVYFKNVSDKAIKQIDFTVLGYDKNGYPVKVQFGHDDYMNCKLDVTLQPGESSDPSWGWDLYNESAEITELRVIVKKVHFYEGDAWENPKYSAELSSLSGKPLK